MQLKILRRCRKFQEIPLNPPEAVKKFKGRGKWEAFPCPGDGKNFLAKRGTDIFVVHGHSTSAGRNENCVVLTEFSSSYQCSFDGIQMNPLNRTDVPPVF